MTLPPPPAPAEASPGSARGSRRPPTGREASATLDVKCLASFCKGPASERAQLPRGPTWPWEHWDFSERRVRVLPDRRASIPSVGGPQTLGHVPLPQAQGSLSDKAHASLSTADPAGSGRLRSPGILGTFVRTAADGKWSGGGGWAAAKPGPSREGRDRGPVAAGL